MKTDDRGHTPGPGESRRRHDGSGSQTRKSGRRVRGSFGTGRWRLRGDSGRDGVCGCPVGSCPANTRHSVGSMFGPHVSVKPQKKKKKRDVKKKGTGNGFIPETRRPGVDALLSTFPPRRQRAPEPAPAPWALGTEAEDEVTEVGPRGPRAGGTGGALRLLSMSCVMWGGGRGPFPACVGSRVQAVPCQGDCSRRGSGKPSLLLAAWCRAAGSAPVSLGPLAWTRTQPHSGVWVPGKGCPQAPAWAVLSRHPWARGAVGRGVRPRLDPYLDASGCHVVRSVPLPPEAQVLGKDGRRLIGL